MREGEMLWAEQALTAEGWQRDVRVELGADGRITAVESGSPVQGRRVGVLLPAPANLHSHAFQRAMAGLTERRGPDPRDSFWTWRRLMYRFLERLGPDELEPIAAFAQMQMLETGFAAVAEFHYLHHRPGGAPYDRLSELSDRIVAAASETGIGLTLLPVLYRHGGCGGKPLEGAQLRFGNSPERFARLREEADAAVRALDADARTGGRDSLAAGGGPRRTRVRRGARAGGSGAHPRRRADGGGRGGRGVPRGAPGGVAAGQRRGGRALVRRACHPHDARRDGESRRRRRGRGPVPDHGGKSRRRDLRRGGLPGAGREARSGDGLQHPHLAGRGAAHAGVLPAPARPGARGAGAARRIHRTHALRGRGPGRRAGRDARCRNAGAGTARRPGGARRGGGGPGRQAGRHAPRQLRLRRAATP